MHDFFFTACSSQCPPADGALTPQPIQLAPFPHQSFENSQTLVTFPADASCLCHCVFTEARFKKLEKR